MLPTTFWSILASFRVEDFGAPLSNNKSTTISCPLLAEQCKGVKPSWKKNIFHDEKN
jgi:hypothetical protein